MNQFCLKRSRQTLACPIFRVRQAALFILSALYNLCYCLKFQVLTNLNLKFASKRTFALKTWNFVQPKAKKCPFHWNFVKSIVFISKTPKSLRIRARSSSFQWWPIAGTEFRRKGGDWSRLVEVFGGVLDSRHWRVPAAFGRSLRVAQHPNPPPFCHFCPKF